MTLYTVSLAEKGYLHSCCCGHVHQIETPLKFWSEDVPEYWFEFCKEKDFLLNLITTPNLLVENLENSKQLIPHIEKAIEYVSTDQGTESSLEGTKKYYMLVHLKNFLKGYLTACSASQTADVFVQVFTMDDLSKEELSL